MSLKRRPTPILPHEVHVTAVRAQGAGGQNVNKVSSAVHLRFDVRHSSLPQDHRERLLALKDHRLTRDGVIVIKAQEHRSQDMNRAEAMARLQALVDSVAEPPKARHATRPTAGSRQRRLQDKRLHGQVKSLRGRAGWQE